MEKKNPPLIDVECVGGTFENFPSNMVPSTWKEQMKNNILTLGFVDLEIFQFYVWLQMRPSILKQNTIDKLYILWKEQSNIDTDIIEEFIYRFITTLYLKGGFDLPSCIRTCNVYIDVIKDYPLDKLHTWILNVPKQNELQPIGKYKVRLLVTYYNSDINISTLNYWDSAVLRILSISE
jgi:hypothetical protein